MIAHRQKSLFFVGSVFLFLASAQIAAAQDNEVAEGPRFISAFEKGGYFDVAETDRFTGVLPRPCERPSEGLRVCREGTEWELESGLIWNDRVLYRLNDDTRAAIVVVPMQFLESSELSQQERDALLLRHVFASGARGPLQIEAVVSDTLDWCGAIQYRTAIVTDELGTQHLLHVYVAREQYATSFIEVTQELASNITLSEIEGINRSAFFELLMPIYFVWDADPYEERPPSSRHRCKAVSDN
jgi:hypothetical protein